MERNKYVSPQINVVVLQLENGIATGSGLTKPQNSEDVVTEWEIGTNESLNNFSWE